MRPAAHPLDALDSDGDGRGVPQLEPNVEDACRRQWQAINAVELPTLAGRSSRG